MMLRGSHPFWIPIESDANKFVLEDVLSAAGVSASNLNSVVILIGAGIKVYSDDAAVPAFSSGDIGQLMVRIINNGGIYGMGGKGGNGGNVVSDSAAAGAAGGDGGTALSVTSGRILVFNNGIIAGGGGGGGGGGGARGVLNYGSFPSLAVAGAGGGGGAVFGAQGTKGSASENYYCYSGNDGADGTLTTPGVWVNAGASDAPLAHISGGGANLYVGNGDGGSGGLPGQPGAAGSRGYAYGNATSGERWGSGGAGGAVGKAVEGNSFITWLAEGARHGLIT